MTKLSICTWNVNSVKARLPNVLAFLQEYNPDILLLQELKCLETDFPRIEFEDLGYNLYINGQKTYNGVAILSKFKVEDILTKIPNFEDDAARYIEGYFNINNQVVRVASVYVPNGMEVGCSKFQYKMSFFDALKNHLNTINQYNEIAIIGGDYNVANLDIDVFDPKGMKDSLCFHPDEKAKFNKILNCGYSDIYRIKNPDSQEFSWWDYRGGSWQHNKGMRIDYLLTNPLATDKATSSEIISKVRGAEKASDHAPVIGWFEV